VESQFSAAALATGRECGQEHEKEEWFQRLVQTVYFDADSGLEERLNIIGSVGDS
jgi:hypothetical protein